MAKFTSKALEALGPNDIGKVLREEGGLWGKVRKNSRAKNGISMSVYVRYKRKNKTKDFCCGTYPRQSIANIHRHRDEARALLAKGLDPAEEAKLSRHRRETENAANLRAIAQEKEEKLTVRDLFDTWTSHGVSRKDHNLQLRRSFENYVFPVLGKKLVRDVRDADLAWILRKMVAKGVQRTAVVLFHDLRQMFGWAEQRQPFRRLLAEGNPARLVDIGKIVKQDYDMSNQRTRTLSRDEIVELHTRLAACWEPTNKEFQADRPVPGKLICAIWIMLSTLCRVGELSLARWDDIDFDKKEWFIPRSNVKGNLSDHRIYLSRFALQWFKALHSITGHTGWCFPSRDGKTSISTKAITKQIADRQAFVGRNGVRLAKRTRSGGSLVLDNGKGGVWRAHDLRRTGATIMQQLGVSLDVLDRCQNHVLAGSKVRRHYLHHDYKEEKREAWERLSTYLSEAVQLSTPVSRWSA